ncbi:MAG: UvrD-helicase domain-containing protein [Anaerolineales bacterium]
MATDNPQLTPPAQNVTITPAMDFLQGLNTAQQQAVMAANGPILVMAGPGSGKTRVLTQRIAYLIGRLGVRSYNILAVTFTNKAAREMEKRVETLLGGSARGLTLGTFHGVCARILRREAEHLPINGNFVIFDADDQQNVVKQILKDLNIDDKQHRPQAVHAAISNAKNELRGPAEYPIKNYRDQVVQRVYERYQQALLASNAVDFDDLLLYTAQLFETNPQVRERYARRFEHVLVDEFQDTNMAQYQLLTHLASFHRNLYCVGDGDQSVYGWRGADYRNLQRFQQDYPDSQVILLEQNYRSTQTILDAAMAVIDKNPHRIKKQLFTERGSGAKITLHEAYDDREESQLIVQTIADKIATKQANPGDFAIMYRTNAQSRVLEEAFIRANLPYKIVGAQRFYGRREVKDVLAYLRAAYNPDDEISLLRIINVPARNIGAKTIETLRKAAQQRQLSSGRALLQLASAAPESPLAAAFSSRTLSSLKTFAIAFANWHATAAESEPQSLLDRILEESQYRAYVEDGSDEGRDRWENVLELRRLAAEYAQSDLATFLEQIALVSDQDTLQEGNANLPTLLTLHAAKGLEFPIVFIAGLNDGILPHSRSFDDPEAMMEERRLLYVGITRAEKLLYLMYSQMRATYGYADYVEPSRFLDDLPPALLTDLHGRTRGGKRGAATPKETARPTSAPANSTRWDSAPTPKKPAASGLQFPAGIRVEHPTWGVGLILASQPQNGDEVLDIFFEEIGMKRVLASMAKLQRVTPEK